MCVPSGPPVCGDLGLIINYSKRSLEDNSDTVYSLAWKISYQPLLLRIIGQPSLFLKSSCASVVMSQKEKLRLNVLISKVFNNKTCMCLYLCVDTGMWVWLVTTARREHQEHQPSIPGLTGSCVLARNWVSSGPLEEKYKLFVAEPSSSIVVF